MLNHKGQTAIVCGSAPCVVSEFDLVRKHRANAIVIAVNDAAAAIHADYLASLHVEKMAEFKAKSLNPSIITLAGKNKREFAFDHYLPKCNSNATSTYSAVQMAREMGCSEIIICGAPMNAEGGYFFRPPNRGTFFKWFTFGDAPITSGMMTYYRTNLRKYATTEDCSMVRSCSGFTAEVFGKPEFLEQWEQQKKTLQQ